MTTVKCIPQRSSSSSFRRLAPVLAMAAILTLGSSARAGTVLSLGEAGNYTVYGFGVTMTPVVGGGGPQITGDVGIGNTGSLTLGVGSDINGNLVLGIGATSTLGGGSTVSGSTTLNHDFTSTETALHAASTGYDAQTADQTFGTINNNTTITANGSNNVTIIDVSSIHLGGSSVLTLSGGANDFFIFNVSGKVTMGGSASITGVSPGHVLFNVTDVNTNGFSVKLGSGTHSIGTFLVPNAGFKVDGGSLAMPVLTGSIIGDGTGGGSGIQMKSTTFVTGATFTGEREVAAAPEPSTIALALTGLVSLGVVGGLRRVRRRMVSRTAGR